jgi:hypothetical protein
MKEFLWHMSDELDATAHSGEIGPIVIDDPAEAAFYDYGLQICSLFEADEAAETPLRELIESGLRPAYGQAVPPFDELLGNAYVRNALQSVYAVAVYRENGDRVAELTRIFLAASIELPNVLIGDAPVRKRAKKRP